MFNFGFKRRKYISGLPGTPLDDWIITDPPDIIGLNIISGVFPNCIVQAVIGGPYEFFGPFINGSLVNFMEVPQVIDLKFFWGNNGYVIYDYEQDVNSITRIFSYLNSSASISYLYIDSLELSIDNINSKVAVIL